MIFNMQLEGLFDCEMIYTLSSDLVTVTAAHRRSDDRRSSQKSKGNWRKKEATFSIKFSFRIE